MIAAVANSLWLSGCLAEAFLFRRSWKQVAATQDAIRRRIVAENAATVFGREHRFSSLHTLRDFQARIPVRDYDQLRPWMERIAAGEEHVLTTDRVRLFEPTGGSSGGTKLIPYTRSLQREFQRGIRPWIADLFTHSPGLMRGRAYWSVSPSLEAQRTPGGIPVGFDDDSAYVGGWQRRLVQSVMAVPADVRSSGDHDAFRYATLRHLIQARDLTLISIWNPSFLSILLDQLEPWRERLAREVDARVRDALHAPSRQEMYERLWPNLRLISCWTNGNAAMPAAHLQTLFPHCRFQGKGLIATEGFVSLPLENHDACALAIRSHFFEFIPLDATNQAITERPRAAHELDQHQRYSVVLTTGGGLYRYRLGDIVEVTGHVQGCPLLRFLGREATVSDWCGEKLHETHVAQVFESAFRRCGMAPQFAMLACEAAARPPRYVLYIDAPGHDDAVVRAAQLIEDGLAQNFHYRYARTLGQLDSVRVFRASRASEAFLRTRMQQGQKGGDIKPLSLGPAGDWSRQFEGVYLDA